MFWPCETRTSICRNLATISSGLYRFLAITVLLDVKDIPQVGPLQWGRITPASCLTDRAELRPAMNPDRMFLIAKGLGLVRRCADRWRQACAAPHPRRYLGRSQATSRDAVLRSSAVVNASSRFWRVFWESQINRYNYLRGRKEIDEKLMCSETPTAGTRPAIYAFEAWSCDFKRRRAESEI